MRFTVEQRIPVPIAMVEATLLDPEFLTGVTLPKIGHPELLDETRTGSTVRRRIRYRFTGDLNAAARRVLDPARLSWVEESVWDLAAHRSTWEVRPDHYADRLTASGVSSLAADGDHATRRRAEGEVRVRMPLVGGKVEGAIVSGLREHAEAEGDAITGWLSRR